MFRFNACLLGTQKLLRLGRRALASWDVWGQRENGCPGTEEAGPGSGAFCN